MSGKSYRGTRTESGCVVEIVQFGVARDLPLRLDLWNHSPTGFEWSYRGSGPAQLSLALLADALDDDARATLLYHRFLFRHVARFDRGDFVITQQQVIGWATDLEREAA